MTHLAESPMGTATTPPTTTLALRAPAPKARRRTSSSPGDRPSVGIYIMIVIAIAIFGIPFIWIVLTALATPQQLNDGVSGLLDLSSPVWSNFIDAVTKVDYLSYGANSLFLSIMTAVLTTFSSATVGFAFARLRAPGKNALFLLVVSTMMIPAMATLIPTYVLFARLGLVGTYWPWVLWGLAGAPFFIFLFRQFFSAVPRELEDAAIMDGAGWIRSYFLVFLPLARPALLTVFLLSFTGAWGDYLAPALLLNMDNTTLAVATTSMYADPRGNPLVPLQSAGAIIYMLPVIIVFLFGQRYFMSSAMGSSVKG
ncbi:carbohydrate ABC transporter permease [Agromyces aureus]|uniref:carbohydrate ABC transporter permease n=1 Tax=Agromyces aureus TaxID=453304 RepID=UPI000AD043E1|nr:carbohydrate ABC transporter permease [Agromyces aureus]